MRFKSAFLRVTLTVLLAPLLTIGAQAPADAQVRFGKLAEAQPGEFRVFAMAAIKGPLETVLAAAQQKIGKPILVEYGGSRGSLHDEIVAGQAWPKGDEDKLRALGRAWTEFSSSIQEISGEFEPLFNLVTSKLP